MKTIPYILVLSFLVISCAKQAAKSLNYSQGPEPRTFGATQLGFIRTWCLSDDVVDGKTLEVVIQSQLDSHALPLKEVEAIVNPESDPFSLWVNDISTTDEKIYEDPMNGFLLVVDRLNEVDYQFAGVLDVADYMGAGPLSIPMTCRIVE